MMKFTRRDWLALSALAGAGLMTLRLDAAPVADDGEMILIPAGAFLMGTTP